MLNTIWAKKGISINKREKANLKHCNYANTFVEYSNYNINSYPNMKDYNQKKDFKIPIIFDDKDADVISNKSVKPIIKKLIINEFYRFHDTIILCFFKNYIILHFTFKMFS